MKLKKSTVRSLLYSVIKKTAEKLKIEFVDLMTANELIIEIKNKDSEVYESLHDFIIAYKIANKKDTAKKIAKLNEARNKLTTKLEQIT